MWIDRKADAMGSELRMSLERADRAAALAASESVLSAVGAADPGDTGAFSPSCVTPTSAPAASAPAPTQSKRRPPFGLPRSLTELETSDKVRPPS